MSGYAVDDLEDEEEKKYYNETCMELLDPSNQEGNDQVLTQTPAFCTEVMKDSLEKATHWFWAALNRPRVTYNLFLDHLQPRFAPTQLTGDECIQFQRILAPYWGPNASGFISQKLIDRQNYLEVLRARHRHRFC